MVEFRLARYVLGCCAAVGLLTGCGSQTLRSTSQAVPPTAHYLHVTVVGARPVTGSCDYSVYIACVTVAKGSPAKVQLCYTPSGSGCTSGPVVRWYDLEGIRSIKGDQRYHRLVWKFDPNPGYRTLDTIIALKRLKNSHGALMYEQGVVACINGCPYQPYGPVYIGIATR